MSESASPPQETLVTRASRRLRGGPYLQLVVLVAAWVIAVSVIDGLSSRSSIYSILILASFLGIAAAGQTLVIMIGGIDLSVPSVIGAANLFVALWSGEGWPIWLAFAAIVAVSGLLGALNGYLSQRFTLPPLIVTLATGAILLGFSLVATGGGNVNGGVPDWLSQFASPIGTVGPIPVPPVIVLWAVLALSMGYFLQFTAAGARLRAAGSSPVAARLGLVRVRRIWVLTFMVSAISSAVLGVILLGFGGSGQPGLGDPYLFTSLAAVLVGGTSLIGGQGSYTRTVIGALIITLLSTLLISFGLPLSVQQILTGVVIFAAVGLYGRESRLRDRV
ncbi:ABC transporter permease [Pseudolysinimonas sp.]|uniref:ABC transporter permease n=1 Tax=Pseudolysinimonas sp. TaxID=2680009 RepID=UPI00286CB5F5|nr:ABC transporter permease [Pseudolysinimonas sp.]